MVQKEFTICNEVGLHARPASELCALCKQFESEIKGNTRIKSFNPKSVISILTAEIKKGTIITIEVNGADEEQAMIRLTTFFDELAGEC